MKRYAKRSFAGGPACKAGGVWGSAQLRKPAYVQLIALKNYLEVQIGMYKLFVLIFCIGAVMIPVMILASIALICCMNQEKRGYKVQLGAFVTGAGLSGIVFALFGIGPAILIGLMCVLYIIVNILST